ncbi:MAG: BatD family protein [Polyangiaceae bacterium]|nr:BatD family protein [Polyangiaceae bacterium]
MRALSACLIASAQLVATSAAATVTLEVSAPGEAEVRQAFRVKLIALSDSQESISSPRLQVAPDFTVSGPSVGSSQSVSFVNGSFTRQRGIQATWIVTPQSTGTFILGPATVHASGNTSKTNRFKIRVVKAGSGPAQTRRQRWPFGTLAPFGGRPGARDPFGGLSPRRRLVAAPAEYQVDSAGDPIAFLQSRVRPARVVVGQQVSFAVYAYGSRGRFQESAPKEASRPDFFAFPILDYSAREPRYEIDIDGAQYVTQRIRETALFPLKTGRLEIGAMSMAFAGRNYRRPTTQQIERSSAPISVEVIEPPVDGRPAGYRLGDVGRYSVTAKVAPQLIEQGDAIRVRIQISGTGNVPRSLLLPEQAGIIWPKPNLSEQIDIKQGQVQGSRTLEFVVTPPRSGAIDLGSATLPFYDPGRRRYGIASVSLGRIHVAPSSTSTPVDPSASDSAGPDQAEPKNGVDARRSLAKMTAVRAAVSPTREARRYLSEQLSLWLGIWLLPALVLVLRRGQQTATRWRQSRKIGAGAKPHEARSALDRARTAARDGETAAVAKAIERAIYASIEHLCGVRGRALLLDDLADVLQHEGMQETLAVECARCLREADALRYGAGAASADELVSAAEQCVGTLLDSSAHWGHGG